MPKNCILFDLRDEKSSYDLVEEIEDNVDDVDIMF
jgi:NADP-dependent 3-hydroxy acid dehydrogenase YdfG